MERDYKEKLQAKMKWRVCEIIHTFTWGDHKFQKWIQDADNEVWGSPTADNDFQEFNFVTP